MSWTTPDVLKTEVQKLWDSGRILAGIVDEVAFREGLREHLSTRGETERPARTAPLEFPLALRFRKPSSRELGTHFEGIRAWIKDIEGSSRAALGAGYDIVWEEVDNRLIGRNALPKSILICSRADALAMIGASEQAARFELLVLDTLQRFPELYEWLQRNPHITLSSAESWNQVLEVVAWFRAHPQSGLYIRQIDVGSVDTKFIEQRKGLLSELLDICLPSRSVDATRSGSIQFEARYGLASRPSLVRFRVLDPNLAISGLTDLTVRVEELANLPLRPERVFVVENDITGLALPPCDGSVVIFGGGYSIELLAAVTWLPKHEVHYWGDIDTHGFAILDRLRSFIPEANSLLMDRETLLDHKQLWSSEETPFIGPLARLTPEEKALYDDLRFDRLGRGVRLEQERISLARFQLWSTAIERKSRLVVTKGERHPTALT